MVTLHVLADSQQPKSESQRLLDRVSELITNLHEVQNARLSSQPPTHLTDVTGPLPVESELGNLKYVFEIWCRCI